MLENYKKVYRNFLKRKINLTTAAMVAILVGSNVFAGEIDLVKPEDFNIATGGVTIERENINGIWGALASGDNNSITADKINGLLGIVSGGDNNDLIVSKINAALGIFSKGDGNTIDSKTYINAILGIFSEGDGNTIDTDRINALVGVIAGGNTNEINLGQVNAGIGALVTGTGNEVNNLDKINALVGLIVGGDANIVTSEKINAALGILVAGNGDEIATGNQITVNNYINALVGVLVDGKENTLTNNGDINAIVAVDVRGEGNRGEGNNVINNGQIIALDAILASGSGHTVINNGDIYGIFNGIKLEGENNIAINKGTIIGLNAMDAVGTENSLVNGEEGTILGLRGMAVTGDSNSIDNKGTIISAGVAGFGGNGIIAEGTGNTVNNSGTVISVGAFGDSAAIRNSGDNGTISNSGALIGASVNLAEGELVLGGSTVIASEGKNVNISNEGGGFIISVGSEGKPSIAINSKGDGGKVENKGTIAAVGLEIADLANLGDIIGGEDGVDIDALLKMLLANDKSGVGILSEGDNKQLVNSGSILAGAGIDSTGNSNIIANNGTMIVTDAITSLGSGNTITNTGTLTVDKGIESIGSNNTITNNLGNIVAKEGIISVGDNNVIRNIFGGIGALGTGTITSDLAISSVGNSNTIENIGTISGNVAIEVVGDDNKISNMRRSALQKGTINSDLAIDVTGDRNTVTNTESINGKLGITMDGSDNTVTNSGNMTLKSGDNSFGIKLAEIGLGTVTNRGTVAVTGEDSTAIEIIGGDALISNSGTVTAKGNGAAGIRAHAHNINISNSGNITLTGDETVALDLMGLNITADNSKNITVTGDDSVGVSLEAMEISMRNSGNITVKGENSLGVSLKAGNILMTNDGRISVEELNAVGINALLNTGARAGSTITNNGTITVTGDNARGINAAGEMIVANSGTINVSGENGYGILASNGATALNTGIIQIDSTTSRALFATGEGSTVNNKGTIKLAHITATQVSQQELDKIRKNAIGAEEGGAFTNDGIIKNADNKIIYAGGDHIIDVYGDRDDFSIAANPGRYEITDMELDRTVNTDLTVVVKGTELNGELNANTDFQKDISSDIEKYLVMIDNLDGALTINGTLNGADYGVMVGEGSSVILKGTINASKVALALNSGSSMDILGGKVTGNVEFKGDATLTADSGKITGDITASGDYKADVTLTNGTKLEGNINLAGGADKVTITEGAIFTGNINLGAGNDELNMDSLSGNLISADSIIDGGLGEDTLNLGTDNMVTVVKGTIQNFDVNNFQGTVLLGAEANILTGISGDSTLLSDSSEFGKGNLEIQKDGNLILGIKELEDGTYNHALTDINGNIIKGEGTLYADTRELTIGKDGILVDLNGTTISLNDDQIKTTQFIYNATISNGNGKFEGTVLDISINKDVTNMGINGKYQDVWNSILAADQELSIENTTTYGEASDLEYLMYQAKERNIYSLGTKLAHDSMKLYQFGTEGFASSPEAGKWLTQAKGIGSYDRNEKSTDFHTTGVLVAGEYGISQDSSVGLSFGAGKQQAKFNDYSSKLEADTFYFGAYGKHKMDNFKFIAGAGYQHNRVDARNISENNFDRFENDSKFDNNGFNVFGKAAYVYEIGTGMRLEPNAGIAFNYLKQDSADEGHKDWAISVDSSTSETTDFKVGLDFVKEFSGPTGTGEAFLTLGHQITAGDRDKDLTARFNGARTNDYSVEGFKLDKNLTSVGAGVDIENVNGFFYGINYSYEFNNRSKNHKVGLGLGYKF